MEIPNEMTQLLSLINSDIFFVIFGIFIIITFLLISFLTFSFVKPLLYLGIPTLISGVIFIIIRFSATFIISLFGNTIKFINIVLPSILKPVLVNGILLLIIGIIMIIVYSLINKKKKVAE